MTLMLVGSTSPARSSLRAGSLVWSTPLSSPRPWALAMRVLAALVLGLIALSAFVLVEGHARHPMVPPSLFHSRSFTGANLVTLLFYMALTGSLFSCLSS